MSRAMTSMDGATQQGNTAVLRDGRVAYIRAVRPDDGPALISFHATLSPETLIFRYFRRVGALTPEEAAWLARADEPDHLALVATCGPAPGAPIVALARYDRVTADDAGNDDGNEAEIGLVVADAWQSCGLGRALFACLVGHARSRGIMTLRAVTQTSNFRVLQMARSAGYPCSGRLDALEVALRWDIRLPAIR